MLKKILLYLKINSLSNYVITGLL